MEGGSRLKITVRNNTKPGAAAAAGAAAARQLPTGSSNEL
jgi:hypothetical protein